MFFSLCAASSQTKWFIIITSYRLSKLGFIFSNFAIKTVLKLRFDYQINV